MAGRGWWLLPILLLCSSLASGAERLALVIGNDRYAHFQPLVQAGGDARRVGDALQSLPQPFEVTRVADVDKVRLSRALTDFQSQLGRGGGEVAFVYYAGHAVDHDNRVWLLPVDARVETPSDIEVAGYPLDEVAKKLRVRGWTAVVLVLDACRNQLFADGRAPGGVRGDVLARGLPPIPRVEGLLLAYATASGQVAKEDTATGGYYTRELLAHLRQPGLRLQDVFNNTALAVQKKTGQKPELNLTAIEPIFLAGQPAAEPIAGPDAERQMWDESRCNASDRPGCEAYLAAHPQGRFAALARVRMGVGAPVASLPAASSASSLQPVTAGIGTRPGEPSRRADLTHCRIQSTDEFGDSRYVDRVSGELIGEKNYRVTFRSGNELFVIHMDHDPENRFRVQHYVRPDFGQTVFFADVLDSSPVYSPDKSVIVGYSVEYRFRGEVYSSQLSCDPGENLPVRVSFKPKDG